ncbi:hypothetical protein G6O42_23940 [Salmonella enterica subsp. enterica serovar Enteritidis]|nr:hypothetical protein [Salmonella enterica subsp. enterica serovar Enteritidis]
MPSRSSRPKARLRPLGFGHRPSTLSLRSSYAGHASLAVSGVAAPREARQGEAWWVRQGSNL